MCTFLYSKLVRDFVFILLYLQYVFFSGRLMLTAQCRIGKCLRTFGSTYLHEYGHLHEKDAETISR